MQSPLVRLFIHHAYILGGIFFILVSLVVMNWTVGTPEAAALAVASGRTLALAGLGCLALGASLHYHETHTGGTHQH